MTVDTQHNDRRALARQELSALKSAFRYEDHRHFEQGEYEPIAERLKRKGQYKFGLGVASAIAFGLGAAVQLVGYGASGEALDLTLGLVMLAFGIGLHAHWAWEGLQLIVKTERIIDLLEAPGDTGQNP